MKTIDNIEEIQNFNSILDDYSFQLELTKKLDKHSDDFSQTIINEIVLWKINRYAELSSGCLELLNKINQNDVKIDTSLTK